MPTQYRRKVFDVIHSLAHPGRKATQKLISEKFVCYNLNKDVNQWAKQCLSCQSSKIQKHVHAQVDTIVVPEKRFIHINIVIVGHLHQSAGFTYLLTIVDRTTRWPDAITVSDITAIVCAKALVEVWISCFGIPLDMTSDRGAQFTSAICNNVAQLHSTTAYHPQSNGLVERFHRTMKTSLKTRLTGRNWIDELPWVLLGIRTVPKQDLYASSAELVYGEPLNVYGSFVTTNTFPWSPLEQHRLPNAVPTSPIVT